MYAWFYGSPNSFISFSMLTFTYHSNFNPYFRPNHKKPILYSVWLFLSVLKKPKEEEEEKEVKKMAPPSQSQRLPSPSQPSGKGEVGELKMQLRQLAGSRAPGAEDLKRELYKKVISYMTIGIDVSSLFSEMVMCSATSDIVLKKMCYLYVGNYAKGHPDLALLTINFLQKDCQDDDPMIRGLALRSLCSLRVMNLVEYLVGPLRAGLQDSNSYVRTVAAIGALKLYHISPIACTESDFPAALKALLLHDPDAQVVASCLSSLQEILTLEGNTSEEASRERELLLSKPVIYLLLNRIKEFSEWAQCLVLDLISNYVPSENNEIFDIMNLLEDRLLSLVYERIKAPLLTLVSSGSSEVSYAVLSHLHLLVMRAPILFSSDYKHFYCRYSDPSYVKKLKLEMLTAVANENNTYDIVTELSEYAANVDVLIARESIRAVGKIALQQYDVNAIVDRLLQFLEMEKDYVTAETLVLVKDLLRKYPQWSHDCIAVVGNVSSKNVQEPKAKAALVWMLGEYSQDMLDAPYVLESLIDNWDEEDSAEDVHDRALFYYRLLQHDVSMAEHVTNPPKQAVSVFADTQSSEVKDRIFDEFNSLSVIYHEPSYMFIDKEHRGPFEFSEEIGTLATGTGSADNVLPSQRVEATDNDLLLSASEKEENRVPFTNGSLSYSAPDYNGSSAPFVTRSPSPTTVAPSVRSEIAGSSAISQTSSVIDDLLGLGPLITAPPSPALKLSPKTSLDPAMFQRKWGQLPIALTQVLHFIGSKSVNRAKRMLRAWKWYQTQLATKPIPTQIVTSGILWATGDIGAQYVSFSNKRHRHHSSEKEENKFKVDWKRVGTTSMFGLGFVGPIGHFWYEGLEHVTKTRLRLRPNSLQFVATKLAADSLLFGPVHLFAFFTYMGFSAGKSFDQVKEDVKRDFLPAFMTEGAFFMLISFFC